jgi:ubiquinone/menaquinone biosynthesis C-methylase UbiE
MKLNLGCGDTPMQGWVNVDLFPGPGVQQIVDLRDRWPWEDSSIDEVRSWHTFEHLPDRIHTMNELWRIMKPAAVAEIQVPTVDGTAAFSSPTHVSYWHRSTFWHFEAGLIHRERWGAREGVIARFIALSEHYDTLPDTVNLTIWLQALK